MSVPQTRETRGMRWADCEDDERAEKEKRAQEAREDKEERAQEAREEQRRAQEAREEERRAQEAREEESRAQDAQEQEKKAQEEQEKEVNVQGERREERKVEAQEGHEEAKEVITQEKCVEAKKENSTHEENDVSNRHMTWWRNAWWVRMDNGPHLRTARGCRRIWRATRRAAEQACDDDERIEETQSFAEEVEGEKWRRKERRERQNKQCSENTLHIVLHLANNTTAPAAAAAMVAATRHQ